MGRQQRAELHNRLVVLLTHLLKLDEQPLEVTHHRSWRMSVLEQRKRVSRLLAANPSSTPEVDRLMADAFDVARVVAARETGIGLSKLPQQCPYSFDRAMNGRIETD